MRLTFRIIKLPEDTIGRIAIEAKPSTYVVPDLNKIILDKVFDSLADIIRSRVTVLKNPSHHK